MEQSEIKQEPQNKLKLWISALLPVFLLIVLLLVFLKFGPLGVFKASVPPIEKAFIQKVIFSPEHIIVDVINDGPEPVTIAQVLVNGAYWKFEMEPSQTLKPLEKGKPWSLLQKFSQENT